MAFRAFYFQMIGSDQKGNFNIMRQSSHCT
uniref:Uncharacterized protein n=1 Tax=Rhizophora mucronata TaxID=61149 RepID=A0A2P2NNL5_RHIMU